MADNPIARLSVDVVANLKINKSQFAKAANEAEKTVKGGLFTGLGESMKETESAFTKLTHSISTSNAFSKMNEKIKNTTKSVGAFFSAIKRIAIYRAIRWALKELIQAFQEGRENAYQWAMITGNKFAKSMDMQATSALYLKNALGAMTMPLTNMLAPVLDRIADAIVNVMNLFNRLFAMISGASSWTMALKYPANYLEKAAGSAKELKNQLLGFDELNILNAPSGGGGGSSMDYSNMFQDVALTGLTGLGKLMLTAGIAQAGVGLVMLFTGHPLLGASLIASGLSTMSIGMQSSSDITADVKKRLSKLSALVGTFSLALGAIILPAKPVLGIALLAAGAANIVGAVALGWDSLTGEIQTQFGWITAIVSGSLLALGVLVLGGGNLGLGIAMITAGATGLVSTVAVSWNNIIGWLKSGFEQIKAVGRAFIDLALGKIVTFIGNILSKLQALWDTIRWGLSHTVDFAVSLAYAFVNNFTAPIQSAIRFIGNLLEELFGKHYNLDVYYPNPTPPGGSFTNGNQGNAITGSGNSHQHGQQNPFEGMDGFATGGFPRTGTMFYAGENGVAEYVGSIGGRTGVYNADQMTVALADANEGIIDQLAAVGNAIVSAIDRKDTSINANDIRIAMRNMNLRYGV